MTLGVSFGNFTFRQTKLAGVIVVKPKVYGDERGYFMETYKRCDFVKGGITANFVQDNQSHSVKGVIRGLHFQKQFPQAKLIRVLSGRIFDVAVDLRPESPTYEQWDGVELSADNRRQIFIPRGVAHGFRVLSETADIAYKCDDVWHPDDERGIRWNDPALGIVWPPVEGETVFDAGSVVLSEKDRRYALWKPKKLTKKACLGDGRDGLIG